MRYLCYISKERVDSLFESAFDGIVDGTTETAGAEKQLGGEVGLSSLIAWLKAGLTFGYKSSNTSQSTKRKSAISRLEAVISFIDKTGSVCDLEEIIAERGQLTCDWYTVSTALRVASWTPDSSRVELIGRVKDFQLRLSCGTANFSGLFKEGDKYIPTSTNRFLFEGAAALPMTGLVILSSVDKKARVILATPLYLVLNPLNEDLGEFEDVAI